MVYLVGGICVINIILWIVFFVKFNKRFSSQKIIEQTRNDMNDLVKDMQRNTAQSIDLINASIARLQQVNSDAEKSINLLNKKLEFINADIATKNGVEKIRSAVQNELGNQNYSKNHDEGNVSQRSRNHDASGNRARAVYPPVNSTQAYQLSREAQRDLFEEEPIEINNDVVVTPDGAAYREVPVITTKILDESNFVKPKTKSINEKVMDLYNMGNSIEEIAAELSISLTEVQFIIDLG